MSGVFAQEPAPTFEPASGGASIIYAVIVDKEDAAKHVAHVRLTVNEPTGSSLTVTFDRQASLLGGPYPIPINGLHATNEKGDKLWTSQFSDQGWPSWTVSTQNTKTLTIEYDVTLNYYWKAIDAYLGYLGSNFMMSIGLWMFLVPSGFSKRPVMANFSLPAGWDVYAPWDRQEGTWYAPSLEYFVTSTFALGTFRVMTRHVVDTDVSIGVYDKWATSMQEEIADASFRIFEYYATAVFTKPPISKYMAIYAPGTDDRKDIGQCEWSQSQGISVVQQFVTGHMVNYAHRVFHIWNVFPPTGMQAGKTEGDWTWWAAEGIAIYYNNRALVDLGYLKGNEPAREDFDRYLREFLGTKNDAALSQAFKLWDVSTDAYFFVTYRKAALVSLLMDALTRKVTNGNKTLDDLMRTLYARYGGMKGVYANKDIIRLLSSITGFDFTPFFDKYIYGKDRLPLKLMPGDLDVDWPELLRVLKLSRFPIMTLTLSDTFPEAGQTVNVTALLATADGKPIGNQTITFYLNSTQRVFMPIGSAVTDESGLATLTFKVEVDRGTYQLVAYYAGSRLFSDAKEAIALTVLPVAVSTTTTTVMPTATAEVSSTLSTQATWLEADWPFLIVILVVVAVAVVVLTRKSKGKGDER